MCVYARVSSGVSPSLLGVDVVKQLVSLVDQGHQLLQQQLLPVLVGLRLLPLWRVNHADQSEETGQMDMRWKS